MEDFLAKLPAGHSLKIEKPTVAHHFGADSNPLMTP